MSPLTFFKCLCFNKLAAQLLCTLGTKSPIQRGQPLGSGCLDDTQDLRVHRENLPARPAKPIPVARITGEFPKNSGTTTGLWQQQPQ